MEKLLAVLLLVCIQEFALHAPVGHALEFTREELEILNQKKIEEVNKATVKTFIQAMNDRDLSVIDKCVHPEGIQHDPQIGDGIQALKEYIQKAFDTKTAQKMEVLRMAADGDLVFVHIKKHKETPHPQSIMHIFRMENGLMVEHWKTSAELTPQLVSSAKNSHPLF